MSRSIDRLLRLARKTGDRLIVHDPNEERDIVIMDLDQYELLVDAQKDLEEYIDDFQTYRDQFPSAQEERRVKEPAYREHVVPVEQPIVAEPYMDMAPSPSYEGEEREEAPLPTESYADSPVSKEDDHEEEFVPMPTLKHIEPDTQEIPVSPVTTGIGNWTPAVSLLEEKFRMLTGNKEGRPEAVKPAVDQEPRRVPMVSHEDMEQEFDEDDDEPVFLEEPV